MAKRSKPTHKAWEPQDSAPYGYTLEGLPRKTPTNTPLSLEEARAEHNRRHSIASKKYVQNNPEKRKAQALAHYYKFADRYLAEQKQWIEENHDEFIQWSRNYREENKERANQNSRNWRASNPEKTAEYSQHRHKAKSTATPQWADVAAMNDIYSQCRKISKATGVDHEVDHIIPLRGKSVCGLHIPHNLMIVPTAINRTKHNKLIEWGAHGLSLGIKYAIDAELNYIVKMKIWRETNIWHLGDVPTDILSRVAARLPCFGPSPKSSDE